MDKKQKDNLATALHLAWVKYTRFFGEPPHGTLKQLKGLVELVAADTENQSDAVKVMYRLAKDDDGHLYVIPAHKSIAWERWLDSRNDEPPVWAESVGGHMSLVEFPEYTIR